MKIMLITIGYDNGKPSFIEAEKFESEKEPLWISTAGIRNAKELRAELKRLTQLAVQEEFDPRFVEIRDK